MHSFLVTSLLAAATATASLSPIPGRPDTIWDDVAPATPRDQAPLPLPKYQHNEADATDYYESEPWSWKSITPTEKLAYHNCFGEYECARLEVPMNWNSTDKDGPTVALALIKLPALVPITDPRYGGPILLNPGGPGGSGVGFALKYAHHIQTIVDAAYTNGSEHYVPADVSAGGKFFDIVSWDPRSVNNTTPFHSCFSDPMELITHIDGTVGLPGTPQWVGQDVWAKQMALASGCMADESLNPKGASIADFMTTEVVVRDMVEIVERIGEWREASTSSSLFDLAWYYTWEELKDLQNKLAWKKGHEPLYYWGFSYGTILGATFASLEPQRSERVVLDGVAHSVDYYHGGWSLNLQDTDHIMDHFFEYCFQAGPTNCSMASPDDKSPSDILARWNAVEQHILTSGPIPVPGNGIRAPQIITTSDIYQVVFAEVYKPHSGFARLDKLLSPIAHSINSTSGINATAFAESKHAVRTANLKAITHKPHSSCNLTAPLDLNDPECAALFRSSFGPSSSPATSFMSIACRDGDPEMGFPALAAFETYHDMLKNQSQWVGDAWGVIRLACSGWPARPADGNGHWWPLRDLPLEAQIGSNATAHPVLFIGNSYDPVTPVRNAFSMSKMFKDSSVLHVDIDGHCTLSGASLCAAKAIRNYFQTGEVVESGTLCRPNLRPFVGDKGEGVAAVEKLDVGSLSWEDRVLFEASESCAGVAH